MIKTGNFDGLIIEGISGSGKSTILKELLKDSRFTNKDNISSIVLSEHQTQRVLESKQNLEAKDNIALLDDILSNLERTYNRLTEMDWAERNRVNHKVSIILERFHFTHAVHYHYMKWSDLIDFDNRLFSLNFKLCLLEIDDSCLTERILESSKNGWQQYLATIGSTKTEILNHYIRKRNQLNELATKTKLPVLKINTSNSTISDTLNSIFTFIDLN